MSSLLIHSIHIEINKYMYLHLYSEFGRQMLSPNLKKAATESKFECILECKEEK